MADVPKDVVEQTHQILKNIRKPARLTDTPWFHCQVEDRQASTESMTSVQALRAVLDDALTVLESESAEYADLLRGRFWEGLTVNQMITAKRPQFVVARTFHNRQSEAIQQFTKILWQQEQACKETLALTLTTAEPVQVTEEEVPPPRTRSRVVVYAAVIVSLLVVVLFAAALVGTRTPTSAQQASATAVSSPGVTASTCGEVGRVTAPSADRFVRSQGVSVFNQVNTANAVLTDKVRSLTIDERGLWIGYFSLGPQAAGGVGHYDKATWAQCLAGTPSLPMDVNAVAVDHNGLLWAATEKNGAAYYNGQEWRVFTSQDGLPSNQTYSVTVDPDGAIWIGTWEGVTRFDGQSWSVPYSTENNTLRNNRVIAVVFDAAKNIWVGHINDGLSYFDSSTQQWKGFTSRNSPLTGDKVRSILLRPSATAGSPEEVWVATADGGISVFSNGAWASYRGGSVLPSDDVRVLTLDRYNRVWAGTSKGTVYFDGTQWLTYHTYDTLSIAIGPDCEQCPFDTDHVWTGTADAGLTHSRIPLPDAVIDVIEVRYPKVVAPGEEFHPKIVVAPRAPYELREDRGDFLSNTDESDDNLFGAYARVPVKGTITGEQHYTFVDHDNAIRAPQLAEGETEREYTSTWRVWMFTRYVGPPIKITFTVRRPSTTPTP
jgi:hypothetical protein